MRLLLLSVAAIVLLLAGASSAQGEFVVLDHSVVYSFELETYFFMVEFNVAPDFFIVDEYGRQLYEFQHYVHYEIPFDYGGFSVLVRGGEIHINSDIPIRDRYGEGGPNSGGWGPIRDVVPYLLDDRTITFSVPASVIGDPDGIISYRLQLCQYGIMTYWCDSVSATPVHPASWSSLKAFFAET